MAISEGILAVPRNRKHMEFLSEPFGGRETTRNSVPFNKNRSKLSGFPSEPFTGRENNSEFHGTEQTIGIPFRTLQRKIKQLGIPFVGKKLKETLGIPFRTIPQKIKLLTVKCRGRQSDQKGFAQCAVSVKLHFFAEFCSIPFRSEIRNWLFRGTQNASEGALSSVI
jgi:hypothetical protein